MALVEGCLPEPWEEASGLWVYELDPCGWQRSAISPIPAYSRTATMPAIAAGLSPKALETAITVPSGALIRNLKCDCASTNSSMVPAMCIQNDNLPTSSSYQQGLAGIVSRSGFTTPLTVDRSGTGR
jgi:hypothetical protein